MLRYFLSKVIDGFIKFSCSFVILSKISNDCLFGAKNFYCYLYWNVVNVLELMLSGDRKFTFK